MLDSAISLAIQKCDFVLTGAEAVVENGGIINKVISFLPFLTFLEY
jgi:translation initiation factor 2B subunit (eIF-2B alpha/beta/delta family)